MISAIVARIIKENFSWVLVGILGIVLFFLFKAFDRERSMRLEDQKVFAKNAMHQIDSHYEEEIVARDRHTRELVLRDSAIASILDSLKAKKVNTIKVIEVQKEVQTLVTEYDTIFKILEPELRTFTKKLDDCLTVDGEFTDTGLSLVANRNMTIYDINYSRRKKFLGLRVGRREYFQTLVTSCGDTVVQNKKITF